MITIRSCSSLRLRPHGLRPAPYVHFEFFEFGQQETSAAADGSDPRFEQAFRFPVDMDSADFSEYLKQARARFRLRVRVRAIPNPNPNPDPDPDRLQRRLQARILSHPNPNL